MNPLPEVVRIESGRGGLRRLVIAAEPAEAEIYLHGAHLTHYQPRGQRPVLFLSRQSWFEAGKPIRGGVPVCFPWFGARTDGRAGPSHGFARLQDWDLAAAERTGDGSVAIDLRLASGKGIPTERDGDFEVSYRLRIGPALGLEFTVHNRSARPLPIEEALHTYLSVSDVRAVSVQGLAGAPYLDTVGELRRKTEGSAPIRITAETDRIYQNTHSTCVVDDPGWQRRLTVEKDGSESTVLWNPWIAKAHAMPDFGDDEWPDMLCIETANVREQAVTIAPGQSHTMRAVIRAE